MELFGGPLALFFFVPVLLAGVSFVVLLVVVVILVRPEREDPRGRRPYATYVFSTMFFSVLVLLGALGGLAVGIGDAIADTGGGGATFRCEGYSQAYLERSSGAETQGVTPEASPFPGFDRPGVEISPVPFPTAFSETQPEECRTVPAGSATAALAIHATLIAAAAGAVLLFHVNRARELIAKEAFHA